MSFVPNRSCPTFGRLLPTRRRTSREYITPREEGATYSRDFSRRGRGKSSSRIEERGVGKRGCWKARRDFEGAGCLGREGERRTKGSKENGFTRQSLSGRPRENHNAKPPSPLLSSFCRTARSPVRPSTSLSSRPSVRLSVHPIVSSSASCHSPRQPLPPPASLFSSHQEFISSPVSLLLLRCSFCSHLFDVTTRLFPTLLTKIFHLSVSKEDRILYRY